RRHLAIPDAEEFGRVRPGEWGFRIRANDTGCHVAKRRENPAVAAPPYVTSAINSRGREQLDGTGLDSAYQRGVTLGSFGLGTLRRDRCTIRSQGWAPRARGAGLPNARQDWRSVRPPWTS